MSKSLQHQSDIQEILKIKKLLLLWVSILVYRNNNNINSRELSNTVATIQAWLFTLKFELFKIK